MPERRLALALLTVACAVVAAALDVAMADSGVIVSTQSGSVQGAVSAAQPGVIVYQRIPYAAPPVGALRWRAPQPALPWLGILDATKPAPGCVQAIDPGNPSAPVSLPWTAEFAHLGPTAEDCLYLDIWTPAAATGRQLPVLVFIHGGAFMSGSVSVPLYDGAALARMNLIVVTINYRLGVLGFLAHPALTQESEHHVSGNYGLLDQVAALRWVHANIAAFGGDPGRVTISGQSAGAISAYLLTVAPQAKGLFQRTIIESGPGALAALDSGSATAASFAQAQKEGADYANSLGASTAAQLRALPAARLLPGGKSFPHLGPVLDGWLLPDDPAKIYAARQQNDVPMIIGMQADEPSFGEDYNGSRAATTRAQSLHALDQLLSERSEVSTQPAYAYYFERAIPWPAHPQFGAFHSGELPYVFDDLAVLDRPWKAADREIAAAVSAYWAAFVSDGVPVAANGPTWPAYKPGSFRFMVFADYPAVRNLFPSP